MVDNTISEVTNVSNVLNSTFGNNRYGRYSKGSVGGSSSGINGKRDADDSEDYQALSEQVSARAVMDRQGVLDTIAVLSESVSVDELVQGVADVINRILASAGGVSDKIAAFEKLAASTSTEYQRSESSQQLAGTINTLIIVLCTGAMTNAAADYNPTSRNEAEDITQRVAAQMDTALLLAGDRGDDDLYSALMGVRTAFLNAMAQISSGLSELMQINTAAPVPALVLANRLYQDASRANELIQEASVPHPAFMPTTMKVLRQ